MMLCRIGEIINAEVCVICRRLRKIKQTLNNFSYSLLREPNSKTVSLFICISESSLTQNKCLPAENGKNHLYFFRNWHEQHQLLRPRKAVYTNKLCHFVALCFQYSMVMS